MLGWAIRLAPADRASTTTQDPMRWFDILTQAATLAGVTDPLIGAWQEILSPKCRSPQSDTSGAETELLLKFVCISHSSSQRNATSQAPGHNSLKSFIAMHSSELTQEQALFEPVLRKSCPVS